MWIALPLLAMTALLVSPACFPNIVVDGRADEQDWQTALQFDDFRLINVGRFEVPPYHTVIKLSPQPQALFIAMWMEIPLHERTRGRSPKDAEAAADPAYVHIDFEGLGRTASVFSVSLSGSRSDAVILNQTEFIQDWDAVCHYPILDATALHMRLGRALAEAQADTIDAVPARPSDRLSDDQRKYVNVLLGQLGHRGDDRFPILEFVVKRKITSTNDLTRVEATRCIDYLHGQIAHGNGPEHDRTGAF